MVGPVLSDRRQFAVAFRHQLRFYLRTWRFAGLLLFTLAISLGVLAVQLYFGAGGTSGREYLNGFLGNVGLDAILVAAFLGGDALAMDFGGGTGYFVLVQPVRRAVLLAGRFAAAFVASLLIVLSYYAVGIAGAAYFYGAGSIPGGPLALSFGLLGLFLLAAVSVAFLFSSFFRTPAISMVVTVLALYLVLDVATGVAEIAHVEPWFSLSYAGGAMSSVFLPSITHESTLAAGGISLAIYQAYPWEAAAIMAGYLAAFLPMSAGIYLRKESTG